MKMTDDYLDRRLLPGANNCVRNYAAVQDGDNILIVFDNPRIADALILAIRESGKKVSVHPYYMGEAMRPMRELPSSLRSPLLDADIVFSVFRNISEERRFRYQLVEFQEGKERRIFHMPGVVEETFAGRGALGLAGEEMEEMIELTSSLAVVLSLADKVRIRSEIFDKTDLTLGIGDDLATGRENVGIISTGHVQKGAWGNLPSGEAFILPTSYQRTGHIVIDRAISNLKPGFNPISLDVINGQISIQNNGHSLEEALREAEKETEEQGLPKENVRRVCEFGIGTNPNATAVNFIEIEKMLHTIHVAVGRNRLFGGRIEAASHIDMVIGRPVVTVDDDFDILVGHLQRDVIRNYTLRSHSDIIPPQKMPLKNSVLLFQERARIQQGRLWRFWQDYRRDQYGTEVGIPDTAKRAADLWESITGLGQKISIRNVVEAGRKKLGLHELEVWQLLQILKQFRIAKIVEEDIPDPGQI